MLEPGMDTPTLLLDHADSVLTITLNQPARLNALDLPQWEELARAFARARDDVAVRALVITGAGRAFSAGADINGMRQRRDAAAQRARLARINPVFQLLVDLPKPTIAAKSLGLFLPFAFYLLPSGGDWRLANL